MVTRSILNNSKLTENKEEHHNTWTVEPRYDYWYFDKKIATVSFIGSKCLVDVQETFAPWAYVSNNNRKFFARLSVVEDQLHGVNIIELDNLQSLFIELTTNEDLKRGKHILASAVKSPMDFTRLFQYECESILESMDKEMLKGSK